AQLVDTDTESDPEEAPSEAEESQPLGSRVPLISEEFEASEPSGTRTVSSYSLVSSNSTAPLSPDHPLTHGEGLSLEDEEVVPECQQQAIPVVETTASEPLRLGYGALRCRKLVVGEDQVDPEDGRVYTDIPAYVPLAAPVQTPQSPEWSLGSLPVSPSSPVVTSPISSPVATPTATISVDEDQFLEVGAQLELHGSIFYDHTQRLDVLPPTLFADIDRDEFGAEQERATVTFRALWRPVLALEEWAWHVDTRMVDMSRARRGAVENSRWYEIG
ncbi:hypothetical protein Tco_0921584, partial [Tanacetum coccineum]